MLLQSPSSTKSELKYNNSKCVAVSFHPIADDCKQNVHVGKDFHRVEKQSKPRIFQHIAAN